VVSFKYSFEYYRGDPLYSKRTLSKGAAEGKAGTKADGAKGKPARTRDRGATEARLLDAGLHVFAAQGFDGATTRQIADAAQVNLQLITRYFGGKEGLLLAIMARHRELQLKSERGAHPPGAMTLQQELAEFLKAALGYSEDEGKFAKVTLGRALVDRVTAEGIKKVRTQARLPALRERLDVHRQRGALRDDVDLGLLADALVHLRFGLVAYGSLIFNLDRNYLDAMAGCIASVLARGLAPPDGRG
jgi:AcrR family transcriptional regulator